MIRNIHMLVWSLVFSACAAAASWCAAPAAGEDTATSPAAPVSTAPAAVADEIPKPNRLGEIPVRRDLSIYPLENANVYVLPINGPIMKDLEFTFHRRAVRAIADGADAIVLDINTPGGALDSMVNISNEILRFTCPVFAYVNPEAISAGSLIALSADVIVMSEGGSIGAAYPILSTGQQVGGGSERVEEKILSYTRSLWRKTAKVRGHDPDLAQRMTDPGFRDIEQRFPGLVHEDELLTLDYDQATSVGLAAFIADDVEDLLKQAGFKDPITHQIDLSWSEEMAGWLSKPMISAALILIALAAFYTEFKTPGIGVPAAIGLTSLALFFWGAHLADLAGYWEIVVFVIGLILLALEALVIPGFGVAGVLGLICIFGSLLFSMARLPGDGFDFGNPLTLSALKTPAMALSLAVVAAAPVFFLLMKYLPSVPLFSSLITDPDRTRTALEEDETRAAPSKWVGKTGLAMSDLRPVGIVQIDGRRLDARTRGDYIDDGDTVRVEEEHGNELIVSLVARKEKPQESGDDF